MMACTTTKQTVITPFCIEMWSQQMLALDSIKLITFKKQIFFEHNKISSFTMVLLQNYKKNFYKQIQNS